MYANFANFTITIRIREYQIAYHNAFFICKCEGQQINRKLENNEISQSLCCLEEKRKSTMKYLEEKSNQQKIGWETMKYLKVSATSKNRRKKQANICLFPNLITFR